jgi:hypothetical protein
MKLSLFILLFIASAFAGVNKDLQPFTNNFLQVESHNQHRRGGGVLVSDKGAIGRWQVTPDCVGFYNIQLHKNVRVADVYNEKTNEIIGAWYLNYCYKKSGSILWAFNNYNMGHNNTTRIYYPYVLRILSVQYLSLAVDGKNIKKMTRNFIYL